ncbi:hypothetical protein [uncultured Bartonella sp.]|uniref:hypothetical protein n=1 Tax=uncultured Bartonella sp. TaxID=104108 RepID=UPI0026067C34|nr:hypothetical protein [uncultured Bartonella sp.]
MPPDGEVIESYDDNGKTDKRDITISTFGYKNHIAIDKHHGTIGYYTTTAASVRDGAQARACFALTQYGLQSLSGDSLSHKRQQDMI